MTMTLNI